MSVGSLDTKWVPEPLVAVAGQNSLPVIIPGWINELTVVAIPGGGGGSCNVQFTGADEALVAADPTTVQWIDWEPGSVAVATSRATTGPVTAVRIQAVTTAATLQIVGQRSRR